MDDKAPFTRIVELLSSVPGAEWHIVMNWNSEWVLCAYIRYDFPIWKTISAREARWMTEEELDTLAIELTFGVG